jgi:hypothetical protein
MRLCARKARDLDVGEVIVFGIISGPSELVIAEWHMRVSQNEPSATISSPVMVL